MRIDCERIRREVRLEELVVRLGGAPLRPVGGELHGPCPRCGGTDRFVVFRRDPTRWYCRQCQASGDAIDLVRHVRGLSFREAVEFLGYEAPKRPRETAREKLRRTFALPPERPDETPESPSAAYEAELARLEPLAPDGVAYLERRGIPIDLALEAGVVYSPAFLGRPSVVFPLVDAEGPCGLSARRIGTVEPSERARTLRLRQGGVFATPGALEAEVPIVVEGPIDALSLAACGYPAIATIGTALPDWLERRLACRPVALGHDADEPGDQAAERVARRLRARGCAVRRVRPPRKDWNDALRDQGVEAIREVLEAAGLRARARNFAPYDPLAPDGDPARHPYLILALLEQHGATVRHEHGRWVIRNGERIDPLLARLIREDWPAVARYLDHRAALERPYMA